LGFILVFQVDAHDFGHGVVNMNGSIITTACNVDTASRDQTIDMLTQPISEVSSEGVGLARPFDIRLINCDSASSGQQNFQVTFDGKRDGAAFGVDGEAHGVGLQIRTENGLIAIPGEPMPEEKIDNNSMLLKYTLRLIVDGEDLHAGSYHTTIRYKLDYY
jgi:type 1 fimbria pilin